MFHSFADRRHFRAAWITAAVFAFGAAATAANAGTADTFASGASLLTNTSYGSKTLPTNVTDVSLTTTTTGLTITAGALTMESLTNAGAVKYTISNGTLTTTNSTLTLGNSAGFTNAQDTTANDLIALTGSGNLTINGANSSTGSGTLGVVLASSGNINASGTGTLAITANISETGGARTLTFTGNTKAVTLSGTNTFSGGLVAASDEVDVTSDASLGAAGGSLTINGGRLGFATNSYTVDPTRSIYLGANTTGSNGTGGAISTKGSVVIAINHALQDLNASTVGDLVKQGGGTLQLGAQSTYTGSTFLNNGFTQLTTAGALPSGTTVNLGQSASANTGTLDLNSFGQQVAGLVSTNSTTGTPTTKNTVTSATAATLTLGGSGTYAYGDGTATNSGVITGALSIVKSGSGTQTFGDVNTYSGGTTINGGKLIIASAATVSATGTGTVTIGASGTLASAAGTPGTAGTGTVTGPVVAVANTSVIAPGATAASNTGTVGALTLAGGLNITTGATIPFDLGAGPTTSDLITISGGTFTGATAAGSVVFNFNAASQASGTYDLISYANAAATGVDLSDFAATGASGTFSFNGNELDFTLAAVPEPGTLFGGALLVGLLGWKQRRQLGRLAGMLAKARLA